MKTLNKSILLALSTLLCHPVSAADNIKISGVLVIPPICTIDNGQTIEVKFDGRMPIDKIDGVNFKKEIPYTLTCGTGTAGLDMQLTLSGTAASFGDGVLDTHLGDLGVQILYGNSSSTANPFTLNKPLKIDPANKPTLWAVPAKKPGGTLVEGQFETTATLKAEYY